GTAVATVGDVAPDTGATVLVTDSTGAPLEAASASATDGADAVSSVTVPTAGTYFVSVGVKYCCSDPKGTGALPAWASAPYTLTVTTQ
ncbi:MAG TPA: hypothetical protein VHE30_30255, partial [Polyangiaceae bacterium]|nr:hypothetical protein [Polyangiaceae bacterium]